MFDVMVNKILSVQGVSLIAYAVLFVAAIFYCRVVVGTGLIQAFQTFFLTAPLSMPMGNFSNSGMGDKLYGLLSTPVEDDSFTMDGGSGISTATEILAKETELILARGEQVEDDFVQPPPASGVGCYSNQGDGFSFGDSYSSELQN